MKINPFLQFLIKVNRAEGLASADINGKSDPFCTLNRISATKRYSKSYKSWA